MAYKSPFDDYFLSCFCCFRNFTELNVNNIVNEVNIMGVIC